MVVSDNITSYTTMPMSEMLEQFQWKFQNILWEERKFYLGANHHTIETLLYSLDFLEREIRQYDSPEALRVAVANGNFTAFGATGLSILDRIYDLLPWPALRDELCLVILNFSAWVAECKGQLNGLQLASALRALISFMPEGRRIPPLSRRENMKLSLVVIAILTGYDREPKNMDCADDDPDTLWHSLFINGLLLAIGSRHTGWVEQALSLFMRTCPPSEISAFFQAMTPESTAAFSEDVSAVIQHYRQRYYKNRMTVH